MPTIVTRGAASARGFGFGGASKPIFILDLVTNSIGAAYGVRKLRAAYAGFALQVQRSSDNTVLNIGFSAAGDLDVASLLTFCGAGSGNVAIWYDQSGNGNDVVQATAANQPQIVNAGALITGPSGKAAVSFNGTTHKLTSVANTVGCFLASAYRQTIAVTNGSGSTMAYGPAGTGQTFCAAPAFIDIYGAAINAPSPPSGWAAWADFISSSTQGFFIDNLVQSATLTFANYAVNTLNSPISVGYYAAATWFFTGLMSEVILLANSTNGVTDGFTVLNNEKVYFGV